jgi:AraC-like DNA-binding protein
MKDWDAPRGGGVTHRLDGATTRHTAARQKERTDTGHTAHPVEASDISRRVQEILKSDVAAGRHHDLRDVAATLSISTPHLSRLLRQNGTTFGRLLDTELTKQALVGLQQGDSVRTVSYRLGYSEPRAFRRAFKRWTGLLPSDFTSAGYRAAERDMH